MKIRKILIVDDEQIILSYLEKKFTKLDYSVYLAGDGEEAVKQAFLNNPDIILLDIKLPKLNGIDVCKKLKADERTKNIPNTYSFGQSTSFRNKNRHCRRSR